MLKRLILPAVVGALLLSGCNMEDSTSSPQGTTLPPVSTTVPLDDNSGTSTMPQSDTSMKTDGMQEPDDSQAPVSSMLSYYGTPIVDKSAGRMENLRLSCAAVDGFLLKRGEEFSFNEVVGPRTAEKGYQEGLIFVAGEEAIEVGGGVCQVATTLYNAARVLGLDITEHHSHSKEVAYEAHPNDAAVYYGQLDMRFLNNTEGDLRIYASTDGAHVMVTFDAA